MIFRNSRDHSFPRILLVALVISRSCASATDGQSSNTALRTGLFALAEKRLDGLLECVAEDEDLPATGNTTHPRQNSPFDCLKKLFVLDFRRLVQVATEVELDNARLTKDNLALIDEVTSTKSKSDLLQNETVQLREELAELKLKLDEEKSRCEVVNLTTTQEQVNEGIWEIETTEVTTTRIAIEEATEVGIESEDISQSTIVELRARFPNKTWDEELFLAIQEQNETALHLTVALGADVNPKGDPPSLHKAANQNFNNPEFAVKAIKFLINHGANATARSYSGDDTFLHALCERLTPSQFDDIATFLVSKNLSHVFNARGRRGRTPFQMAVSRIEIETGTLSLLHKNGVDFNAVGRYDKDSVLEHAVKSTRSLQLVSALVNLGANPNHLNVKGESLLHIAAKFSARDVVKYFIDLGLDVNSLNKYGWSPLTYAVYGHGPVAEKVGLLLDRGADVKIMYKGKTLLEMGLEDGYIIREKEAVLQLLSEAE